MSTDSGMHKVRQVEAIANGTVIDHLPPEATLKVVDLIARADDQIFIGLNLRSSHHGLKGVVKFAKRELDPRELSALALIAPQATVSIIRDYAITSKGTVSMPERFEGIARCANPNCVSNHERWTTRFDVAKVKPLSVRCHYCERTFLGSELTLL
jgi:aspartate carbamoyltransferase regulatory subunit